MADEPTPAPAPTPESTPAPAPTPAPEMTPSPTPAPTPALTPAAWREGITDPEAKKLAETSTDLNHFAKRTLEMRQKLSTAVVIPGKDAKPEEVAEYRKKIGVPEKHDEYLKAFPQPEAGQELPSETLASRSKWAERFHAANLPAEVAASLIKGVIEDAAAQHEAIKAADAKYAKESEEALRREWPGEEYDRNKTFATRAAKDLLGADYESAMTVEDKTGRFVLDNPIFAKMLAKIGREMGEDRIGAVISDSDKGALNTQITDLRRQQAEAQSKGESKRANELYQQEQQLLAKLGNQPVVGARGRAA